MSLTSPSLLNPLHPHVKGCQYVHLSVLALLVPEPQLRRWCTGTRSRRRRHSYRSSRYYVPFCIWKALQHCREDAILLRSVLVLRHLRRLAEAI